MFIAGSSDFALLSYRVKITGNSDYLPKIFLFRFLEWMGLRTDVPHLKEKSDLLMTKKNEEKQSVRPGFGCFRKLVHETVRSWSWELAQLSNWVLTTGIICRTDAVRILCKCKWANIRLKQSKTHIGEPRYNKRPGPWQNMFDITRFRDIEVLFYISYYHYWGEYRSLVSPN